MIMEPTCNLYLITYGAENENYLVHADDICHAIDQFCSAEMCGPNELDNLNAITDVYVCQNLTHLRLK